MRRAGRGMAGTLFPLALLGFGCQGGPYLVVDVEVQGVFVDPVNGQSETFGAALHALSVTATDQNGGQAGPIQLAATPGNAVLSTLETIEGKKALVSFVIRAPLGAVVNVTVNGLDAAGNVLGTAFGQSAPLAANTQSIDLPMLKHCGTVQDCDQSPDCVSCTRGACEPTATCVFTCAAGSTACGGVSDAGVDAGPLLCVETSTDTSNCGGCGIVCARGQVCVDGGCGCTEQTPNLCGGGCVDLFDDPRNCGSCGTTCLTGQVCLDGGCGCPGSVPVFCPETGTCVNPDNDPLNCGACAHSCLGGACTAGACGPTVLVSGQDYPSALVIEQGTLFWINQGAPIPVQDAGPINRSGSILRLALDGGKTPATVVQSQDNIAGLVADGGWIYWGTSTQLEDADGGVTTTGALNELAIGSTTPVVLIPTVGAPAGLALGDTDLYWTETDLCPLCSNAIPEEGAQTVLRLLKVPLGSSPAAKTTTIESYSAEVAAPFLALTQDTVYVLGSNPAYTGTTLNVYGVSIDAGSTAVEWDVSGTAPSSMALDERNLYFGAAPQFSIFGIEPIPALYYVPLDGGAAVNALPGAASSMVSDGVFLYWTDNDAGDLWRAPIDGGLPEPIVTDQDNPEGLILDDSALYWVNNIADGGILRLAR